MNFSSPNFSQKIQYNKFLFYFCAQLMNEYSLIFYMARLIDETKIERIKEATLKMVVNKGYGGASISEIAKKACVAEGYLYRHYKSKSDLVNDLLYSNMNELADKIEALLSNQPSIEQIFEQLIQSLFEIAIHQPDRIKFLYVLMNDYNFNIQESQRARIDELCKKIKILGVQTNSIRPNIGLEEIYLLGVAYPIQYINIRLKKFFDDSELGENEIVNVLTTCLNSLKS
jgi:TetR/AcrR family transcriptional regulator, repressor of fatR-cypB operon